MTHYLFTVVHDVPSDQYEATLEPGEYELIDAGVDAFNAKAMAEGVWVFAGGLTPIDQATTVDNSAGAGLVVDGPFSESKEHLGGFWVLDFPDLDVALRWAQEASAACRVPVEVRAFEGLVGLQEAI